jgi:hypothetical protein
MEARKLAVQLAAVCPFALVLGMGVSFRHSPLAHSTLQYSPAQNERVEAYSTLMLHSSLSGQRPPAIENYADTWIRLARHDGLQALTPAFQEDLEEENPRSQIIQTWTILMQRMTCNVRQDLKLHHLTAAVREATRVLRFGEILKYSDFDTLNIADTNSTRALTLIQPVLPFASQREKQNLHSAVQAEDRGRAKLPEMYKVLRSNYEDYVFRRDGVGQQIGDEPAKIANGTGAGDDAELEMTAQQLQRHYVMAVRRQVDLRNAGFKALGLPANSVKS